MRLHPLPIAAAIAAALTVPALAVGAQGPDPVVVRNSPAEPVPTNVVGTPTVALSGNPVVGIDPDANTVRLADAPSAAPESFQQLISASDQDGPDPACGTVQVPTGKLLTIQNVIVSTAVATPDSSAFVRVTPGAGVFLGIPLDGTGSVRRGQLETTLLAGPVGEPSVREFDVDVCLSDGPLSAIVTGTLSPAPPTES